MGSPERPGAEGFRPRSPAVGAGGWTEDRVAEALASAGAEAERLRAAADAARAEAKGDRVLLRGLVEFSNFCSNHCLYCGIRARDAAGGTCPGPGVRRYRMTEDEISAAAREIRSEGSCDTVVLQSGVDAYWTEERIARLVRRVREETGLVVTLSVGTREKRTLAAWREAGAERFLLRFETSDAELFARIHPDETLERRAACLRDLRECGYEVGSGFMFGLPGWSFRSVARDLLFTRELELDMIGCGPFIAAPGTPMADERDGATPDLVCNVVALLRLMNPRANIPAATALDSLEEGLRDRALRCGANVFMPNFTPRAYRDAYNLYPKKTSVDDAGMRSVRERVEKSRTA